MKRTRNSSLLNTLQQNIDMDTRKTGWIVIGCRHEKYAWRDYRIERKLVNQPLLAANVLFFSFFFLS